MIVMLFFLNNMYVMKDKNILITGNRNYHHGLWNIPVQKPQIQIDNYIATVPHPSIYPSRITIAHETSYSSTPSSKSSSPRINLLKMAFKHTYRLIEHNECDHVITQQHNQDANALALVETIPNHSSLSVIIRKNKHTLILLNIFMHHVFCW